MKSKIVKAVEENPTYPKLMISNTGDIVLFSCENTGMVVHGPMGYDEDEDRYNEGYYCETWIMDRFKDFNGTIELLNS